MSVCPVLSTVRNPEARGVNAIYPGSPKGIGVARAAGDAWYNAISPGIVVSDRFDRSCGTRLIPAPHPADYGDRSRVVPMGVASDGQCPGACGTYLTACYPGTPVSIARVFGVISAML